MLNEHICIDFLYFSAHANTQCCLSFLATPGVCVRQHTFFQWPKTVTWSYHISTGKPQFQNTTDGRGWGWRWWVVMIMLAAAAAGVCRSLHIFPGFLAEIPLCHLADFCKNNIDWTICTHFDLGFCHHTHECNQCCGGGGLWVSND